LHIFRDAAATKKADPGEPDGEAIPPVPTPATDARLRIPEVLDKPEMAPARVESTGLVGMGRAWGVALDFMGTILLAGGLGWGFDRWRGSGTTGALVGLGLGFALALYRIIRFTMKEDSRERASQAERRRGSP
jgi:F0F1-type ATP synthase assembly protein I